MTTLRTKKIMIIGLLFLAFIIVGLFFGDTSIEYRENVLNHTQENTTEALSYDQIEIEINSTEFNVLIADTQKKRGLGLGLLDSLDEWDGMIFVFDELGVYPFWMKGMKFPIDIFWLDSDGFIVGMHPNAQPDDFPLTYAPDAMALYVLELTAGAGELYDLKLGDQIEFDN